MCDSDGEESEKLIADARREAQTAGLPAKDFGRMLVASGVVFVVGVPLCVMIASLGAGVGWIALLLAVFLLWLIGILWWSEARLNERRATLQAISRKLGLELERFELITTSINYVESLEHLETGTRDEVRFARFDYHFSVPKEPTLWQTVVWLNWKSNRLPSFIIRPRDGWTKDVLGWFTSRNEFAFESHPTFAKSHQIRGEDANAIRSVFSEDVLNFFEQDSNITVEVSGDKLLYYRTGVCVDGEASLLLLNEAFELLALLQPTKNERH